MQDFILLQTINVQGLGVAIGRCTSVDGLRIINFKDEVCLPHPETVELFCSRTCLDPDPDLKCCRNNYEII
jgi:hypothetical protein